APGGAVPGAPVVLRPPRRRQRAGAVRGGPPPAPRHGVPGPPGAGRRRGGTGMRVERLDASPVSPAAVRALLATLGVPDALAGAGVRLDALVAAAGEPALALLVLHLEAALPEPFPVDLLHQVTTLGDLLGFAEVKYSRTFEA